MIYDFRFMIGAAAAARITEGDALLSACLPRAGEIINHQS